MTFELLTPETPEEAIRLLGAGPPGSRVVLAGGTDLLFDLDRPTGEAPSHVLSLRKLPWRELRWEEQALAVGSTLPLSEVEREPRVRDRIPGLYTAILAVGSRPLRHRATLGGNLARAAPASDLLPILLALEATVHLVGSSGPRSIPVGRFVRGSRRTELAPDELIRSVTIPIAPSTYLWQRVRPANDISQVGVAVARPPGGGWRIAVGGVQPSPQRLPSAESKLSEPSRPADAQIEAAAEEAARVAPFPSDKRATEEYRRRIVRVLVDRAIRAVAAQGAA